MRRISPAKHLRWKLDLSQAEFARPFEFPLGTLRDWASSDSLFVAPVGL
jgi:DNA-binding transcriptional regulator YiaG